MPSPLGCSYPWTPDQRDGTYRNPILLADYSDPDVIRVGDDYWMTASSFNCTPGLPILHSRDLVNWSLVNHAIDRVPGTRYRQVQHGQGVWAPAIRFHDGRFWVFFPTPDEGIYVTTASDPRGRWSEPHLMAPGKGLIDPCPLWDDDGRAYLAIAFAGSRAGEAMKHRLHVFEMAADASRLLGEGTTVYRNPDRHPTLEGPKLHKRNGWYFISAPAGGVATGWQVIFRARAVFGPYEDRVVLSQRDTIVNGPHQGALVDTPDGGEWWFLHFQEHPPYGRIVHLQPVTWRDDWPMIGVEQDESGVGKPVLRHRKPKSSSADARTGTVPATSDEFNGPQLGRQWQWHANQDEARAWLSLGDRRGWLRLFTNPVVDADLARAPNLLLQKLPAEEFTFETNVDWRELPDSARAGTVVMGKSHAALAVDGSGTVALLIDNRVIVSKPIERKPIRLRVAMRFAGRCSFSYAAGEHELTTIGLEFQAVEGHWIGAKVGLFCIAGGNTPVAGHADFEYARFDRVSQENSP